MVLLSTLRQQCSALNMSRLLKLKPQPGVILKRHGGHGHTLEIRPSNWNFKKMKDLWHFYTCIAFIIYAPFIIYAHVFIGSATLREIPEGYRPKHWEYYRHPISRLMEKYCFEDPQENYEKFLHFMYNEDEERKLRQLDAEVDRVMKRKKDYEAHYYLPLTIPANAIRGEKIQSDEIKYHGADSLTSSGFNIGVGDKDSDITGEYTAIPKGVDM